MIRRYASAAVSLLLLLGGGCASAPVAPTDAAQLVATAEEQVQAGKGRAITLNVELVARRCLPAAFFGQELADLTKEEVDRELTKGLKAVRRLIVADPYIAGPEFTLADLYAFQSFPLASGVIAKTHGRDILAEIPEVKGVLELVGQRASAKAVAS